MMLSRRRSVIMGAVAGGSFLVATGTWALGSSTAETSDGDAGAGAQARPGPEGLAVPESQTPGPVPEGLNGESSADDVIPVVAERIAVLGEGRGFAGQVTDYAGRSITVR